MPSLDAAIRYPMEGDAWKKTVIIGGVLTLFGFLLIPLFAVYGYVVRVVRDGLEDGSEPPVFGDWVDLIVDGIKVFVIGVVYFLVPGIVFALTVGGSMAAIATGTRGGMAAGAAGFGLGALLGLVLTVVASYLAVAAIVNFVAEDRVGAAFEFGTLRAVITTRAYAMAWLLSVVVFIVAALVSGILNVVPFLGAILGAFVFFYAEVVAAHLWADGFTAAIYDGDRRSVGVEDPAV